VLFAWQLLTSSDAFGSITNQKIGSQPVTMILDATAHAGVAAGDK